MTIIKSINNIENVQRSALTIGNFDGLHKGHQVLIKKTVEYARENNIKSIVFTFNTHPVNYFVPNTIKSVITNEEKINRLKSLGVDIVIDIPFDEYMTKISANNFVKDILVNKLNIEKLTIGHDFTFARNKEGNVESLKLLSKIYAFELEVVNPIKINDIRVSSTYIRNLVKNGEVESIKNYLGYNYQIKGEVIHARKLGRTIGFPTANMYINKNMVIPKQGIYATKVYIDDKVYFGATNIGYNPTVNGQNLSIETHILEFDEDIYSKVIQVEFLERIRDEKKFSSIDELKNQLEKDTNYVFENYVCKRNEYMIK